MRALTGHRLLIWRLLGLAITGSMVLTLGVALRNGQQESERQIEDRFAARGQLAATFVATWSKQTFADERRVAQTSLWGDVDISRRFNEAVTAMGFPAAVLVDSRGRALAIFPPAPRLIGTRLDGKFAHLAAALDGTPTASGAIRSAARGEPVVAFAVPFSGDDGRRVFSGAYTLNNTPITPFLNAITVTPGAAVYLVDSQNQLVASSKQAEAILPEDLRSAHASETRGQFRAADGRDTFFARQPVPGTPWTIVVTAPHEALLATVQGTDRLVTWLLLALLALLGAGANVLVWRLVRSRNQLRVSNAGLHDAALVDVLTGLPNRRHLDAALDATLSAGKRHQLPVSLLLVDIDHFKQVNDTHGHHVGDQVLIHVADILRASVRREDVVGRWGGEEFLAVLPHTGRRGTAQLAKRLCDDVSQSPFHGPDGIPVPVTVSVGSVTSLDDPDIETLLRDADKALYQAKDAGRNTVRDAAQDTPERVWAHS